MILYIKFIQIYCSDILESLRKYILVFVMESFNFCFVVYGSVKNVYDNSLKVYFVGNISNFQDVIYQNYVILFLSIFCYIFMV